MGSGSISKRRKKRSQSQKHSKKRSRRNKDKSKKPKRRHDSVSGSEEDSKSNSLLSRSSSEEEYRGRKRARSRDRKDRKDRKKRVKRGNSVSESSGDDSPVVKKRKKSKMSKGSESRKKRHGKKRKRSPSVSSSSGRSMSRSSCERSGGSEEEVKERKGREKGKEKRVSKKREKSKERSLGKRRRSRSRSPCSLRSESNSYGSEDRMVKENNTKRSVNKTNHRSESRSPYSLHSESHSYDSEARMVEENNTKRLKSIIVVVHEKDEAEIRDSNWDGNKAEIVFEHDEYPSRSNDSNDGVIRRETSSFSHDVDSGKLKSLDDTNREIVPCDVQTSEIPESQSVVSENTGGINLTTSGSGGNGQSQLKGNGIGGSVETASSNDDDLAAVLRQKALENFLKRQVKSSAKNAGDKNSEPNSSSSLKTDQAPHTSALHSGLKSVQKLGKADEVDNTTDLPSSSKADNNASQPRRESGISRLTEKYTAPSGFADSRTKLGLSSPRNEFIGARNTWRRQLVSQASSLTNPEQNRGKDTKQKLDSEESSQQNLSTSNKTIIRDSRQQLTSQEVSQTNPLTLKTPVDGLPHSKRQLTSQEVSQPNLSAPKVINLRSIKGSGSSRIDSTASASQPSDIVEHGSNENTNETDGDSQFQQKTMSVMRGGEMVQVSYKVYIPNKAPALARRQLKR